MKTKSKLYAILASLILVFGLTYAPLTSATQAQTSSQICDTLHNVGEYYCSGQPTNCMCAIVVEPEVN